MARAIPVYQRQNLATGVQSGPTASSSVSANDPTAQALGGLANVAGNAMSVLGDEAIRAADDNRRKLESEAAVNTTNVLSQGDVYWQENATRRMQAWKVGDPDMRETIGADFDKWAGETEGKLTTDASRKYFRQHAATMKSRLQTNAFSFQEKSRTELLNANEAQADQLDENTVYNDPVRFKEITERKIAAMRARTDISEAEKVKAETLYKRKMALSVERGEMTRDPVGWYTRRFGEFRPAGTPGAPGAAATAPGGAGFAGVMERIFQHEGGYNPADGGNGKPVNFGINQGYNPDVDVKNLTKEGAAKIYKDRYWDKIKGDTLPPALQGTAMDAAVNQGPENAKKWIEASGGDPVKFNELRRAHYEKLLQDPDNAKYRNTWMKRLTSYERDAAGGVGPAAAPGAPPGDRAVAASQPVIEQPVTFRMMDWEQQDALRSVAETRIKQDGAQFKAQIDGILRDAAEMHKDGIQDPQPIPMETFARAYGAEAPRMYAEYEKSRLMAADISGYKTMSEAEIGGSLEASAPKPGPGYAAEDARYRTRVQAAQSVLKQREADPAGYATKNSQVLTGKRAALDVPTLSAEERPRLMQDYVRANLAEQQRLGIASPKVLTPRQTDAIALRAMNATKPEDSANLIGGLEAEYGEFFPRVFDQLVKEGKIAGELLIIPNLPSQAAREAVSRLARVKEADLVQGLDAQGQKAAKEAVTATLTELAGTVALPTDASARTINAYETTLRKMTYQAMQGGASAGEAAERARAMLLGQYEFKGTIRFPKTVNQSQAMAGAARVLAKELGDIDLPRDLTGARKPDEVRAEWADTVRARPQWFTRQDDGGLELWAVGNNGVRYRVTRGGQGVAYTWEQLAAQTTTAAVEARSAGSGARERARTFREQARERIEATRRQVEAEDGAK